MRSENENERSEVCGATDRRCGESGPTAQQNNASCATTHHHCYEYDATNGKPQIVAHTNGHHYWVIRYEDYTTPQEDAAIQRNVVITECEFSAQGHKHHNKLQIR